MRPEPEEKNEEDLALDESYYEDDDNEEKSNDDYKCPLTGADFKYVPGDPFW